MRLADAVTNLETSFKEHAHPDLESSIEELAAVIIGPTRTRLAGGGRDERKGLVWKIDNGGVKLYLPAWTKVAGLVLILAQIASSFRELFL